MKQKQYKSVLIARFSALGDVAMTIPVVYSLCRTYPATRFVMVTQIVASSLFINKPDNLTVVGVDVKNRYKGPRGMWRLVREMKRDHDIEAFADLHSVIRTHFINLFCRLHGITVSRINKGRAEKKQLTRQHNKCLRQLPTSRDRYAATFERLGFSFGENFVSVYPEGAPEKLYAEITAEKQCGEHWIAVAPFAKHQGKIYPPGLMKNVVLTLASRHDTHLFLFGGGSYEKGILDGWEAEVPDKITSLAGKKFGFAKELALLSHCDVMLSMDSANMHLASLVELPVVSIWGATHPYCGFTGWKPEKGRIVQSNLPCRPCSTFGNKPCLRSDYACLRSISPDIIINNIDEVLKKR